jgi:Zn-dependent protease
VPPLDGSKIIGEIFGGKVAVFLFNIQRGGMMIIFILLWLPPVSQFFTNTIIWIVTEMGNLAGMLV